MKNIYIGLGSNLNNPISQVKTALRILTTIPATHLQIHSSLYRSKAIGPKNQPNYINAVAILSTRLSPFNLLHKLQTIENERGRTRNGKRWQARVLDLDILMYDNKQLHTKKLTLPHPELYNRMFVLAPLYECVPELILPNGQRLSDLIQHNFHEKVWQI
ncbi:2-amino-4-hydroxy-6-hydroxymethyldihydropteridine diphosphokinase [Candidatus Halobeggiatoa sp. HSG11]|nr:2-amino-4-hydroxy-6-hydroxymethyldihydropteridine diphosphokinase [Candidatus Halobeggiatoa sp. HSG11]